MRNKTIKLSLDLIVLGLPGYENQIFKILNFECGTKLSVINLVDRIPIEMFEKGCSIHYFAAIVFLNDCRSRKLYDYYLRAGNLFIVYLCTLMLLTIVRSVEEMASVVTLRHQVSLLFLDMYK